MAQTGTDAVPEMAGGAKSGGESGGSFDAALTAARAKPQVKETEEKAQAGVVKKEPAEDVKKSDDGAGDVVPAVQVAVAGGCAAAKTEDACRMWKDEGEEKKSDDGTVQKAAVTDVAATTPDVAAVVATMMRVGPPAPMLVPLNEVSFEVMAGAKGAAQKVMRAPGVAKAAKAAVGAALEGAVKKPEVPAEESEKSDAPVVEPVKQEKAAKAVRSGGGAGGGRLERR